ncbi:thermonuclease family protein [Ponticaulis sp.]|uniref:thermonuclease family protein n=1 Tax=Ponticaulis sp. TaxID=2020902 RepID=UPI000B752613|nr:thermonuclease family protein [Ponticaulis sp.]MAI90057.1 hypothetical protein [Ponticaulis sp.]OUX99713.1 MAG: hypothetical protein CBB65_06420 [Hyphomonadaceae bacterium TMED5]|tara:strand:+ start:11672 stop:12154 length:483 start_codon:yes stop_codon:yes gene_type:complete
MKEIIIIAVMVAAGIAATAITERTPAPDAERAPVSNIYWSDGDSGRLDGQPFRLANVDSPETGGVGAIGGARCEEEREIGYDAKEFIVELTRNADVQIARSYGADRYGREVVDLNVNGQSLARIGLNAGHYRPWPHDGQRALARKPDWCGSLGIEVAEAG